MAWLWYLWEGAALREACLLYRVFERIRRGALLAPVDISDDSLVLARLAPGIARHAFVESLVAIGRPTVVAACPASTVACLCGFIKRFASHQVLQGLINPAFGAVVSHERVDVDEPI